MELDDSRGSKAPSEEDETVTTASDACVGEDSSSEQAISKAAANRGNKYLIFMVNLFFFKDTS